MNISDLPMEMLVKICSYLPTLKQISLVSRKFYVVQSEFYHRNHTMSLHTNLLVSVPF